MDPSEKKMYSLAEMDVLLAAAREGDVLTIGRLVRPELDIDTRGRHEDCPNERVGSTMLEKAATHSQLDTMKFLIQQGANIDSFRRDIPDEENTILLKAAFMGRPDVAKVAIENGADINRRRFRGSSVLHEAVEDISAENLESKVAVVEILVKHGLDIDVFDEDGYTALHWVAGSGNFHMAKVLVSEGANVNAHVKHRDTPLDRAAWGGNLELAKFLLQEGAVANVDAAGCRGLGWAASSGQTALVSFLLDNGAEANTTPPITCPELFEAALSGNAETVALLYKRGFASQGAYSVRAAIMQGQLSAVEVLLAQGIDINATRGRDGQSFLHAAVLCQSYRAKSRAEVVKSELPWNEVRFLLDKGADATIRASNGQTALDLAVVSGLMDAVEIFDAKSR